MVQLRMHHGSRWRILRLVGPTVCMGVLVAATLVSMVLVARAALRNGREGAQRWGTIEIRHEALRGPGAFRSGVLTERRPHRAPWIVWVAGLAGAWMGPARAIAFVPVLTVTALDALSRAHHGGFHVLPLAAVLGAAASLFLAWFLFSASMELLRCVREAGARARLVGLFVVGLDVATLVGLVVSAEPVDRFAHVAIGLLIVGATHGAILTAAGQRTHHRQAVLSNEEWGALPDE